tara:strand:- start:2639 stop:2893 length:255 start_codon:yes stop_codon:yes gene_type:complete
MSGQPAYQVNCGELRLLKRPRADGTFMESAIVEFEVPPMPSVRRSARVEKMAKEAGSFAPTVLEATHRWSEPAYGRALPLRLRR